jgi:hypothetical protein
MRSIINLIYRLATTKYERSVCILNHLIKRFNKLWKEVYKLYIRIYGFPLISIHVWLFVHAYLRCLGPLETHKEPILRSWLLSCFFFFVNKLLWLDKIKMLRFLHWTTTQIISLERRSKVLIVDTLIILCVLFSVLFVFVFVWNLEINTDIYVIYGSN